MVQRLRSGPVTMAMLVAATLVASGCALLPGAGRSDEASGTPEPSSSTSVALSDSEATDVPVTDAWTVAVPPGAGPADSTLTVTPLDDADIPGVLARAEVTLSSGQPQKPLTFRYRLPEPLPSGEQLFLISYDAHASNSAEPAATQVIEPQISPDRRTATAEVTHLSIKEWLVARVEDANHFLTSAAGLRARPPSCPSQPRPRWMDDVVYVEDRNAPMLVCTGSDPHDSDTAVVKIRNNRGVALIVTAPVTPTWAFVDLHSGQISALTAEVLSATTDAMGVPADRRSRTWVLPPGGGVDLGFTEQSLAPLNGSSTITATVSTSSLAYGVLWNAIEEAADDPAVLTALELGVMGVCVTDGLTTTVSAADLGALTGGIASLVMCGVERTPDILAEIQGRLSTQMWDQLTEKGITRTAAVVAGKLMALLGIGKATVVAGDLISTLALSSGAYEITLFTQVKPPPATAESICGGRVEDTRSVPHPHLGTVQVSTVLNGEPGPGGGGCVAAISSSGQILIRVDLAVYGDALDFAEPTTDATGNVFLTYNPGRYNGVLTLVPNVDGFETIEWDDGSGPNYTSTSHVYYYAELEGPGADGQYTIRQFDNDCNPSCAAGTITDRILRWDGRAYS